MYDLRTCRTRVISSIHASAALMECIYYWRSKSELWEVPLLIQKMCEFKPSRVNVLNLTLEKHFTSSKTKIFQQSVNLWKSIQYVQNAASKMILRTPKADHASPLLQKLQWLPIICRIEHTRSSSTQKKWNLLKIWTYYNKYVWTF